MSRNRVTDEGIIVKRKNELQEELSSFYNPVVLDIPDFLTDPKKEDERRIVIEKLLDLLKRRFSLIAIADILQTNDYSRIDQIIEERDKIDSIATKYPEEVSREIKPYSDFKKKVGDEKARIYAEQEKKMKATLEIFLSGSYFDKAQAQGESVENYIEDLIGNIIDHSDFSLACQIESDFASNDLKRIYDTLKDINARSELQELIDELKEVSDKIEVRAHAYRVMNKLIAGQKQMMPEEINDDENR